MVMEQVMVPHRWDSICSLRLNTLIFPKLVYESDHVTWKRLYEEAYFWEEACDVFSKMRGLQNLRISFTRGMRGNTLLGDINKLALVLKPLMAVQQVSNFNVDICWPIPVNRNELQHKLGGKPPFCLEVVEEAGHPWDGTSEA